MIAMDTGILNLLTRQQVYIEGVKNWFSIDLNRYLKLLRDFLQETLNRLGVKSLAELSKASLNAVLRKIDKQANEILSGYGTEFLAELRRFGRVTMTMQRSAYAVVTPKVDMSGLSISSVWSSAKDRIVPAFGKNLKDTTSDLINTARDKIRSRLNVGYADSEPLTDTVEAVSSLNPQSDPSTLKIIGNGIRGFVSTAIQHTASTVSDFVGSLVHDCYQWCSVIDSKTSPICRERNGNVYRNGDGPLSPAHNHCRSHSVPVACDDKGAVPTFYNWLLNQSSDFLTDAFGASFARKAGNGSLTKSDLPDVVSYSPLSLDEYELKVKLLTA